MRVTPDDCAGRAPHIDVPTPATVLIACLTPGCGFVAVALTEGRALTALAGHIVYAHILPIGAAGCASETRERRALEAAGKEPPQ